MKNLLRLSLLLALLLLTLGYLHRTEPRYQAHIKKSWPLIHSAAEKTLHQPPASKWNLGWSFPAGLAVFFLLEFFPFRRKKTSAFSSHLKFIVILGVGLAAGLIYYIYSLPTNQINLGSMQIQRGSAQTFLQSILHYVVLLGNAHLISLLTFSLWIHRKPPLPLKKGNKKISKSIPDQRKKS